MAVAAPAPRRTPRLPRVTVPRVPAEVLFGAALAVVLVTIGLRGGGGTALGPTTSIEMALLLGGGLLAALAALAHDGRRLHGGPALAAFGVLTALTAVSILWAVEPSDAWLETSRTLAYLAVFASGVVLAREAGAFWSGVLGAVVAFSAVVSGFAVLTKVLPGVLNPDEVFARLREPYDYWNSVGLTAAIGMPAALWLGARRHGFMPANALAYPVVGLQLITILLAYSRGALLAAVVGLALWFVLVPLRLRGATVLAVGAAGALPVMAWAFSQDGLTEDRIPLGARENAGLELGLAVLAMLVVLAAAGMAIAFAAARRPPRAETRRYAGTALLVALALVPVGFLGALALSDKGLNGSITEGWKSLTDPDATTPANDPSRLTAVGSVRARYWDQAIKVFGDHVVEGVGAGGYPTARRRYREDELVVRHAHGYVVQVMADLGVAGLVANGLLLVAFAVAAFRALQGRLRMPDPRAPRPPDAAHWTPERIGLATLLTVVVVFGVHSAIDWTWFTPGTAVPALLCAGWLAGRGPGHLPPRDPAGLRHRLARGARLPVRAGVAGALVLVALVSAWAVWQPLRSVHAGDAAIDRLDTARTPADFAEARELAQTARDRNPLAVQPLFELATIEVVAGRPPAARQALEDAVGLQPENPETWLRLAEFTLKTENQPQRATELLGPALYLDPRSDQAAALYLQAARAAGGTTGAGAPAGAVPTPSPTTP